MVKTAPKFIRIKHDEYDAKYVGKTRDGRQFFLTTPFTLKRECIALYVFDTNGELLNAKIDDLGSRNHLSREHWHQIIATRLDELGEKRFCNIKIAPFKVQRFATQFGLIVQQPEEDGGSWWVSVELGDYMAFYPPWNGEYDT